MITVCNKSVKAGKSKEAIFGIFSNGVVTARDEWVYDFSKEKIELKARLFFEYYAKALLKYKTNNQISEVETNFKLSRNLKNHIKRNSNLEFNEENIIRGIRKPFVKYFMYFDKGINDEIGYYKSFIGNNQYENKIICFNGSNSVQWDPIAINTVADFNFLYGGSQSLPLYRYTSTGERIDNITDWGLQQFTDYYKNENIAKIDLFHYTYAVLHNPAYRKKYELNLKREFPRIPFYDNFFQWRDWGKQLMDLHINYETVKPYDLKVQQYEQKAEAKRQKEFFSKVEEAEVLYGRQPKIKVKLKADKEAGIIEIDELTLLSGVPSEAWEYKLGNRSAPRMDSRSIQRKKTN